MSAVPVWFRRDPRAWPVAEYASHLAPPPTAARLQRFKAGGG